MKLLIVTLVTCLALHSTAISIVAMDSDLDDACAGTGSGWTLVRSVPPGDKWHPARDQLKGTEEYGDPADTKQPFSIKFHQDDFDQFLFSTGDCDKWLIVSKEHVVGEDGNAFYANQGRTILKSSKDESSYAAKWYRRKDTLEDPWISLTDHNHAIGNNDILYGENSYGGQHAAILSLHNGARVFIRKDFIDGTCYADDRGSRLLPQYSTSSTNSPEECKKICGDVKGFLYAGVQWEKECWCGNDKPPKDKVQASSQCNMDCPGDASQKCGAGLRMNIYKTDGAGLCPTGFEAISQNLDGAGKVWSQPHPLPTRTKDSCAAICIARTGCTSFEFAEGKYEHGACGTYTGGDANIQGDENRLSANSNWRSCLRKPRMALEDLQHLLEITTNLTRVQRAEIQVLQRQQQHYMELNKEKNDQLAAKDAIIEILKEIQEFCNLQSISLELEREQNEVSNPGCDVGDMYDGKCYLLVSTPATWQDAQLGCTSRNGSLASVHNEGTNHFISSLAGGGDSRTWIGASDAETEGEWKWTDGNIATFSNWSPRNPDNWNGNQNCLVSINYLETGNWDDDRCDKLYPYVCHGQKLIGI